MAATDLIKSPVTKTRQSTVRITAVHTGIVMALLAVVIGTFFEVRPPEAYGICMACHGRDLVNSFLNSTFSTNLTISPASAVFPLLTSVGVFVGALVAAVAHGEFRWRTPDNPLRMFIYGILVMNFALLAAGCSIRLLLRAAHGEVLGILGFGGLILGASAATFWLSWRIKQ